MSPFPPRFLNRDASFFDLCLYALWPLQFQSGDNFSSPAKTVRYASLCLYIGVWIIVSPLPRRFLKRDSSSFDICTVVKMLQFYARVVVKLELRYVQRPLYNTRRMHGIVGERDCVVDMRCI